MMTKRALNFSLLLLCVSALGLGGCQATGRDASKKDKPSSALESVAQAAADSGMKESLVFTERLYREDPNNPDYIVKYARDLRRAGRVEDAKLVIRTPAKGKRATAEMMTEAAMVLIANGEYDEATGFAQKALEKAPKSADAHHALALAMSGLDQHEDAQLQFQKAFDLWPEGRDQTPIINNLAMSLAAQGKIDEARLIMGMATGEALSSPTYQNNRAMLDSLEARGVRAEKIAPQMIQETPDAKRPAPLARPVAKMRPIIE